LDFHRVAVTVSSTTNRVSYTGNGSTTAFAFSHPFRLTADLVVTVRTTATGAESLKTEGSDYTVSGTADSGTGGYTSGTVTFGTAPASGTQVHIDRVVTRTQTSDFISGDGIPPASIEGALDKLSLSVQELDARFARTLLQPRTAANRSLVLPEPSSGASDKILGINTTGTAYELKTANTSATTSTISYTQPLTGGTARTLLSRLSDFVSVKDFGATGNGSTDDTAAIQAAIDAISSSGGTAFFPSGDYAVASSLTLKSYVRLVGVGRGSRLLWTGGASTMITTNSAGVLIQAGMSDLAIDTVGASKGIELYGPYNCAFTNIALDGLSSTSVALDIRATSTGGTNPEGNRNAVFNSFSNIHHEGRCGTFIRMIGLAGTPQVVTLNTLHACSADDVRVIGYDFAEWADNNCFTGMCRVNLQANNAVGAYHNSAHATDNRGVYANNFDMLAVDNFGSLTGRVGIKMNYCKFNTVALYFNEPLAEGGTLVTTSGSESYSIGRIQPSTNFFEKIMRGREYIINDGDHIRLATIDETKGWGINVDSSTGDLRITRQSGSGVIQMGTHTASGDAAVSGYITIKDAGGTTRKLAVIT